MDLKKEELLAFFMDVDSVCSYVAARGLDEKSRMELLTLSLASRAYYRQLNADKNQSLSHSIPVKVIKDEGN
jgi:hypothetical protein